MARTRLKKPSQQAKQKAQQPTPKAAPTAFASIEVSDDDVLHSDELSARAQARQPSAPSAKDVAKARMLVENALAHGLHRDDIVMAACSEHPWLNEDKVRRMIRRTREKWGEVDEASRPQRKIEQGRRVLAAIAAARSQGKFGAVAALERVYAGIFGTFEPVHVVHDVDVELQRNAVAVLSSMSEEERRRLADDARERRRMRGERVVLDAIADSAE